MAEEPTTHVVYKGNHYALPGQLSPDEALLRVRNLTSEGPKLRRGAPVQGFEDTTAETAAVLERNPEPNRARDVLPKLVEFGLLASTATVPAAGARGVAALRGLSTGAKAKKVAQTAGVVAGGVAADQTLQSLGVPAWLSESILAVGGLSSKPGRALLKAGIKALSGERAAGAAPAAARTAATAASAAPAVEAAPAAVGVAEIDAAVARAAQANPAVPRESLRRMIENSYRSAGTPVAPAPPTRGATALAPEPVPLTGQRAPATNLGGKAKAGPAPTKPEDLEATLRKSLEAIAEKKGGAALQGQRVEVGAQNVGRSVGMTKEEVRQVAGPVLGEARGEASPVLPQKAFNSIYEKMKAMPAAERRTYVLLAKDTKTMGQLETMRRVFERAGLVLPAGAAGFSVLRKIAASGEGS